MRLRKVAGEWFPTIPADVLDRIVAAAWIEGREANGGSGERTAVVAAAAVRRHGLRALRGDGIDLPDDAEKRIAALTADEAASEPRAQRFRRRARPEALGRRAPDDPVVVDERSDAPAPAVQELPARDDVEDDGPPTRRRRGRATRPVRADRRQPDDAERGPRSLRILAETVQIITGRRADDDKEIVEVVADEAPPKPGAQARRPRRAAPPAAARAARRAGASPAAPAPPAAEARRSATTPAAIQAATPPSPRLRRRAPLSPPLAPPAAPPRAAPAAPAAAPPRSAPRPAAVAGARRARGRGDRAAGPRLRGRARRRHAAHLRPPPGRPARALPADVAASRAAARRLLRRRGRRDRARQLALRRRQGRHARRPGPRARQRQRHRPGRADDGGQDAGPARRRPSA